MMRRKELKLSRWWLIPTLVCGVGAYAYTQSHGFSPWLSFGCAVCAAGLFTTGLYVVLGLYTGWKARRNGWPYDVP